MGKMGKQTKELYTTLTGPVTKASADVASDLFRQADFLGTRSQQRSKKAALEAAKKQEQLVLKQQQIERLNLAEEENEVARRRAYLTRPKSRSLLVATSPRGVANLGGSNG